MIKREMNLSEERLRVPGATSHGVAREDRVGAAGDGEGQAGDTDARHYVGTPSTAPEGRGGRWWEWSRWRASDGVKSGMGCRERG